MNKENIIQEDIKRSFWDYSSLMFGNAWAILFTGLTIVAITRVIDPSAYGILTVFHMVCQVFVLFIARWNHNSLLRYAREEFITEGKVNRVVWARLFFIMPIIVFAVLIVYLFSGSFGEYINFKTKAAVYAIPVYFILLIALDFIYNIARSTGKIRVYSYSIILEKFLVFCGVYLIASKIISPSIGSIIGVYIIGAFVTTVVFFLFLKPSLWFPPVFDKAVLKKIFSYSYPFMLITICMVGMGWIDIFFLRFFERLSQVGIYSLSYRLMSFVQMLSTFTATVALPIIIAFYAKKRKDLIVKYLKRIVPKAIFLWSIFLAVFLFAINYLFPFIFSSDYQSSLNPLRFLLCGLTFFFIFSLHSPVIQAYEMVHKGRWGFLLALVVNIVGDVILIPRIGITGAAYSTIAAFVMLGVWYYLLTDKIVGVRRGVGMLLYTFPVWVVFLSIRYSQNTIYVAAFWLAASLIGAVFLAKISRLFEKKDADLLKAVHMPRVIRMVAEKIILFLAAQGGGSPAKRRILYLLPSYTLGGTESHIARLIKELKKRDYEPSICFLYKNFDIIERLEREKVDIRCLNMEHILDIRGFFRLWKILKNGNYDIAHSYLFDANIYLPLVARIAGVKTIVTSRRNYDDWMRWHHIVVQRIMNFFTNKIFVNSQCVKKLVMKQEGVKDEKVLSIYNSIEKGKFCKSSHEQSVIKEQEGARLGIQGNDMVVTMLGKFKNSKGHGFLLEAAKTVIAEVPGVKFLLLGKGPLQHSMKQKAKELGISDKVIFAGETYAPAHMIAMSDVCVLSSIREGFSNALMEYMAAAKAIVVTDVGGNSELIRSNENGLLVPKKDTRALSGAIISLLRDKAKREQFGKRAFERISDVEFEPEYEAERYNTIYRELLNVAEARENVLGMAYRRTLRFLTTVKSAQRLKESYYSEVPDLCREIKSIKPREARGNKDNYNVIIISIDPLRRDHVGTYGYRRSTTPCIDSFSRQCAVFNNAYSQAPWTTPSHMSLFTSLYPSSHMVDQPMCDSMRKLGSDKKTLAECLKENGYLTAAFTGSGSISGKWGFSKGFDVYDETPTPLKKDRGHDIPIIFGKATSWMEKNKQSNFFLFFHTYNTHTPYSNRYFADKERIPFWNTKKFINALYDSEIKTTDYYIGRLVRFLKNAGILKNTIIFILSDHGEDFGEHYPFEMTGGHGHSLYQELLRIPFIVYHPSLKQVNMKIEERVRLIDVMPTALDALGLPSPEGIEGKSILPLLAGKTLKMPEYFYAEATCFGPERKAVIGKRFKYIYTAYPDAQRTERKISPVSMNELYDIIDDPDEKNNIYDKKSSTALELKKELTGFMGRLKEKHKSAPVENINVDEKLKARLRALGYID